MHGGLTYSFGWYSTRLVPTRRNGHRSQCVPQLHRARVSIRIRKREPFASDGDECVQRLHLVPLMPSLPDLPDEVLACISSHLTDLGGISCTSKACYTGTQTEVSQRLIRSYVYYKALRITCLSRRKLMSHAFVRERDGFGYCPAYTCSMCRSTTQCLGGCAYCRRMTREHPWMCVWHHALPVYVIRMFHHGD